MTILSSISEMTNDEWMTICLCLWTIISALGGVVAGIIIATPKIKK